ncbi:hypothetical protein [Flavobacterium sp.]|uniref:hypothetical protein n=1 Tax=Flavobacterium sp. TaxID=239 RepID=UPI002617CB0D|nr:hypothetical protein [Flavobacterium sp.]MDG2432171.1 hypothetical protein [Flavobacterium sp.]
MKTLKTITGIALVALLGFTSCQSEVNEVDGQNPNTNAANSTATTNFKRTAMFDGSADDMLDGTSCSSIVLPAVATVNGIRVSLFTQADYQQVISILGQFNNDQDTVVLQFPLKVKTSNYTEVAVNSQSEYNAIVNGCTSAQSSGQSAISSVKITFPMTILTYNTSFQQTGSLVFTSNQQLYTYMSNISSTELFSVKYPLALTLIDGSKTNVSSDAEFKAAIEASLKTKATMEAAVQSSKQMETILVNGMFKVQSFVNSGVDSATTYKDFTIDFANDMSIKVFNGLTTAANGTYATSSQTDVFLKLTFSGNASMSLLNNTWKVTSFNSTSINLQSSTNAAVTLVLRQI